MKTYVCPICRHEVSSESQPQSIKWSDGHICHFIREEILTQSELLNEVDSQLLDQNKDVSSDLRVELTFLALSHPELCDMESVVPLVRSSRPDGKVEKIEDLEFGFAFKVKTVKVFKGFCLPVGSRLPYRDESQVLDMPYTCYSNINEVVRDGWRVDK